MGRTYNKSTRSFDEYDDRVSSGRSGKHAKHTNGKKTGGMKTLNSYVEEDYDDYDLNDDSFDEEIEIDDEIYIQYIKNKT